MPSFSFQLSNGDTFRDDAETAFGTLEEAKEFARSVAAELGRNRSPEEIEHLSIRVTDETGREVFRTKLVNLQRRATADAITRAARRKTR
ncbi:MAG TPA: hypothetical protein VH397_12325 [Xanthobacteraceae bacterium]|jgi:hypothetical protein